MVKRKVEEEEESFPRGRGENPEGIVQLPKSGDAEGDDEGAPKKSKKKAKTGKKKDARPEDDDMPTAEPGGVVPSARLMTAPRRMKAADFVEGSLVVCAVREVTMDGITVNMPFNNLGFIPLEQAIEPALARAAEGKEPLPPLPDLYKPGQLVTAVVLSLREKKLPTGKASLRLELSLRPRLLNAGLDASSLLAGMWLPAAILDEQEHAYRVDFGVEGLKGILKKSELPKDAVAKPGVILQVGIVSAKVSAGMARCTLTPEQALDVEDLKLEHLKAGFLVSGRIARTFWGKQVAVDSDDEGDEDEDVDEQTGKKKQRKPDGVVLSFCGALLGTVHRQHHGQTPLVGRKTVSARVLAVVPGQTTTIHLTLLPNLLDWGTQPEKIQSITLGARVRAEVVASLGGYGVECFCVPNADKADANDSAKKKRNAAASQVVSFIPASKLSDKSIEEDSKKNGNKFVPGAQVTCRVLGYNYLENCLVLSARPFDLKADMLVSVAELSPGQIVDGTIAKILEDGVQVRLSEYITSFIPLRHLTDVPMASVPNKMKVDSNIRCRVLRILPEKHQVSLTAKKTLVKSGFALTNIAQARPNMILQGFVGTVKDFGAIVHFYGDLRALVPPEEMKAEEAPTFGMVATVKLTRVDFKRGRLTASLDLTNGQVPAAGAGSNAESVLIQGEPGQTVTGVHAIACSEHGVMVLVTGNKGDDVPIRGFIQTGHLSDDFETAQKKYETLKKTLGGLKECSNETYEGAGQAVDLKQEAIVLFDRHRLRAPGADDSTNFDEPIVALLTLKPSLLAAAKEGAFATKITDVEPTKIYDGYVREVREHIAVVSVGAWWVTGSIPKAALAHSFVENPSDVVKVGQSVKILVTQVDVERRRFKGDLRLDGPKGKKTEGSSKALESKELGAMVDISVKKVQGLTVVCQAKGAQGFLHATQMLDLQDCKYGVGYSPLEKVDTSGRLKCRILKVGSDQVVHDKDDEDAQASGKTMSRLILTSRPSLLKDGLVPDKVASNQISWAKLELGDQVLAGVVEVGTDKIILEVAEKVRGRVSALDCSMDPKITEAPGLYFKPGQIYKARVIHLNKTKKQLGLSLISPEEDSSLQVGSSTKAQLQKIEDCSKGGCAARFLLHGDAIGLCHITELNDKWIADPRKDLEEGKYYEVAVLKEEESDKKESGKAKEKMPSKHFQVSMRDSKVKAKKAGQNEKRPKFSELKVGSIVNGYVVNSTPNGVFVAISPGVTGRLRLKELPDAKIDPEKVATLYPAGRLIKDAKVQEIDAAGKKFELSLLKGTSLDQLSVGSIVSGAVTRVERFGVFVRLDGSTISGLVHSSELGDANLAKLSDFKEGDRLPRVKVISIEHGKVSLSLKPSHFEGLPEGEEAKGVKRKTDDSKAQESTSKGSAKKKAKKR